MSSCFYSQKTWLICMGHPLSVVPCKHEPDEDVLLLARKALQRGRLNKREFACIEMDIQGYPGSHILDIPGPDPTGAKAKRARYACERAYAKIGRRLCELCKILWSLDRPKGPRLDAQKNLRYHRKDFPIVRASQIGKGSIKVKRRQGMRSIDHLL